MDPVDEEIQELMAKASLTDAETARLHLLLEPAPQQWTWRRSYQWLYRRLSGPLMSRPASRYWPACARSAPLLGFMLDQRTEALHATQRELEETKRELALLRRRAALGLPLTDDPDGPR